MDLTDLQVELCSIEQRIAALHLEIEKMKPQTEKEKKENFEAITKLARKHPLTNSVMSSVPEPIRKQLIGGLSSLLQTDEKDSYEGLLYLLRLSCGWGLELSAEDIYRAGLKFNLEDIEKSCAVLQEYKHTYLVETFVIAGLAEEKWNEKLVAIADMAVLMKCDKEEVQVTAQVAKCRLTGDWDSLKELPVPSGSRWMGKLGEYIPKEWIIGQRIRCGCLCETKWEHPYIGFGFFMLPVSDKPPVEKHPCIIKSKVQAGNIVRKGSFLLEYEEEEESNNNTGLYRVEESKPRVKKTITAPCNGIVYFIENNIKRVIQNQNKYDKYLNVYVISYFDKYEDLCEWHKEHQHEKETYQDGNFYSR